MRQPESHSSATASSGDPELSVVVVNWNGGDTILDCLTSIPEATGDLKTEVVVVDNGSTDDSVEKIKARHPAVTLIESETNLGFGQGVQAGLEGSGADCVAAVNPDVLLSPDSLHALVSLLELHPQAAWAGPRIVTPEGIVQSGPFRLFSKWQPLRYVTGLAPLLLLVSRLRGRDSSQANVTEPVRCERLSGACMVFRRQFLDEIGGMPRETFMYGEEQLLGARFKERGYEAWYDPRSSVTHEDALAARQAWPGQERLLHVRVGLLAAMKHSLSSWDFFLYNGLFLLATLIQSVVGLTGGGRGYSPRVAGRFLKASLVAFVRTPDMVRQAPAPAVLDSTAKAG